LINATAFGMGIGVELGRLGFANDGYLEHCGHIYQKCILLFNQ
jgi:hypothetical protein